MTLDWLKKSGWLLVVSFILLQPFKNLFELPMAMMALFGLLLLLRQPHTVLGSPALTPMLIMFGCFWLPMVASLTDAANLARSLETVLVFLRFPLAAIFVLWALDTEDARRRLLTVLGVALAFSAVDILVQAVAGYDLFGFPSVEGRMPGVIHGKLVVGHIMAVLSPVYFYWVRESAQQRRWVWLLIPLYGAAILLTGARAAWVMLGLGMVLFALQLIVVEKVRWKWQAICAVLLLAAMTAGGLMQSTAWRAKFETTKGLFSGNYEQANAATSARLPIWSVATRVAKDHWINGVGPRGFRYVYPDYVPKDDMWLQHSTTGPTHPHELILEIAVETGVIGLLGYLLAVGYWIRRGALAILSRQRLALPWMATVLIVFFPLHAGHAFYGSFWSTMVWWLIFLAVSHLSVSGSHPVSKTYTKDL